MATSSHSQGTLFFFYGYNSDVKGLVCRKFFVKAIMELLLKPLAQLHQSACASCGHHLHYNGSFAPWNATYKLRNCCNKQSCC